MSDRCPVDRCSGTLEADRNVCRACEADLRQALAEIPALVHHLHTRLTRQTGRSTSWGRCPDSPLPYDPKAAEALSVIRATLVGWIRDLSDDDPTRQPRDTITAMCCWLLARTTRILAHPAAAEIVTEITSAYRRGDRAAVGPAPRMYFGACDCGEDLHVRHGATTARCNVCGTEHDVAQRLAHIEVEVASMLLPIRDIARIAALLGDHPDIARTEARLNLWAHRGRLPRAGQTRDGRATYRYELAMAELSRVVEQRSHRVMKYGSGG